MYNHHIIFDQYYINIDEKSLMKFCSNNDLVNRTLMGEKLGYAYKVYPDPDMYGMCYDRGEIE